VAALRYLENGGETTALNLGTGRGYSVREVVDAAARVTGAVPDCRYVGRRPGDPPMLVADASAARRVLGFQAKWTDLDAIIASAWAWYRKGVKIGSTR